MSYTPHILPLVVPVVFWAGYHYYKDRHLPEPVPHLLLAFLLGVGSFFLGLLGYEILGLLNLRYDPFHLAETNLPGLIVFSILGIGLVEELAKMIPFLLVIIHLKSFNEAIDGIIYASFIALGYAAVENYHYLDFLTGPESVARGFAGPVVHILFASIWAHWITRAWLTERRLFGPALAGFAVAAFLHGIYDFLVLRQPVAALPIAATLIGVIWVWRLQLMRRLHEDAVGDTGGSQAGS